jgi:hypothetical protein
VKFYLDGKQIFDIDDVVDQAKLDSNRLLETEITDDYMGPGEIIWILKYSGRKTDQDRAADLFENHLNAAVEYCAAGGRFAMECTDKAEVSGRLVNAARGCRAPTCVPLPRICGVDSTFGSSVAYG